VSLRKELIGVRCGFWGLEKVTPRLRVSGRYSVAGSPFALVGFASFDIGTATDYREFLPGDKIKMESKGMRNANAGQRPGEIPKDPFPIPARPPRPPEQTPSNPVNIPSPDHDVIFPNSEPVGILPGTGHSARSGTARCFLSYLL
jgi:hypothetical protein